MADGILMSVVKSNGTIVETLEHGFICGMAMLNDYASFKSFIASQIQAPASSFRLECLMNGRRSAVDQQANLDYISLFLQRNRQIEPQFIAVDPSFTISKPQSGALPPVEPVTKAFEILNEAHGAATGKASGGSTNVGIGIPGVASIGGGTQHEHHEFSARLDVTTKVSATSTLSSDAESIAFWQASVGQAQASAAAFSSYAATAERHAVSAAQVGGTQIRSAQSIQDIMPPLPQLPNITGSAIDAPASTPTVDAKK
eukprot:TRINITY_DN7191_c0_g1_i1.p1 TRINITY_DN7191_c0_g1~~TRINITY_DN7191_c0_g1_i1.p1  ORF type:complete len:276 (-),score=51.25 TRINITY_DN7191_c0_g1_i1:160-930(-)